MMLEIDGHIDWQQLRDQKFRLIHFIHTFGDDNEDSLWGIIHLLDAIQDAAFASGVVEVFGSDPEGKS